MSNAKVRHRRRRRNRWAKLRSEAFRIWCRSDDILDRLYEIELRLEVPRRVVITGKQRDRNAVYL